MKLTDILTVDRIVPQLESTEKTQAISEFVRRGFLQDDKTKGLSLEDEARLVQVLLDREKLGSTAIKDGLAIPHGRISGLPHLSAALAISRDGLDFGASDQALSRIFIILFAPESAGTEHLRALARISRLFTGGRLQRHLLACQTRDEIYEEIAAEDARYP